MILLDSRSILALAAAGLLALGCAGRSATGSDDGRDRDVAEGDGRDAGRDGSGSDNRVDGQVPDGTVPDFGGDTGPVANAIAPIQQSDTSVDCPPGGSTETPSFLNGDTGLVIDAVVVTPRWVVSKDSTTGDPKLFGYVVMDAGLPTAAAWRGIAITVTPDLNPTAWNVGDVVSLTGDHQEYYCFTQFKVTAASPMGTGVVPAPLDVDPADLGSQDPSTAEPLEGVLVRVRNVEVLETPHNGSDGKDHGSFKATGGLVVANDFKVPYMSTGTDDRKVGDRFDEIVGVVKYSYGEYILTPRTADDMVPEGQGQPDGTGSDLPAPQDVIDAGETTTPAGTTLESLQKAAESTGCTAQSIQTIQSGLEFAPLVVVSPKFVASAGKLDGYFVADGGQRTARDFAGAQLNIDVAQATAFQPGDVLDVTGDWLEYYCLTEVKATAATANGTASLPAPKVVQASSLAAQDAAAWEPLEGVLVQFDDVTVTDANPDAGAGKDYGSFAVAGGVIVANTFKVNYMNQATDQRTVGDRFTRIVGVVTYSFGKYVVLPRTDADLVLEGTPPPDTTEPVPDVVEPAPDAADPGPQPTGYKVADLQGGADSENCSGGENFGTPKYGISLAPVVVTSGKYSATATFEAYYVSDPAGGDHSGLLLLVQKSLGTNFVPGDVLDVTGDYWEYYCMSEVQVAETATAPKTVGSVARTGTATPPAPVVLAASVLQNGGTAAAEKYEGRIVTVQNLAVTSATATDGKGWFELGTGVQVDDDFFYGTTPPYTPTVGNNLTVTGALKWYWGKYRICPRNGADIVVNH